MQLKTYFSDSVDAALARASSELGPEAMLVYAKDTPSESKHLGRSEVVFATQTTRPREAPGRIPAGMQYEIADIARMLAAGSEAPGPLPSPVARARMIKEIRTDAALRRGRGRASISIFAGPPGSGKTISIAKLAARQITHRQPPPLLVSFDNRVGAGEPLRSYASALDCQFELAATPDDALAAIERAAADDLVLVDTPGLAPFDTKLADALHSLLRGCAPAELHLTLSAGLKAADLSEAVERFQRFRPTKLLFTRLDETGTYGPLWSEAVRWNIPVSFLAFGQQIPEDIEPATAVRLADLALRPGQDWLRHRGRKAVGASA
jgi:flagellar biosynthesis protein FlhF